MFLRMPDQPRQFGLKFQIRLSDLEAADVLRVRCPQCGHVSAVEPHDLLSRLPSYSRIMDLETKMRCRRCHHRGSMRWYIERAYPPLS